MNKKTIGFLIVLAVLVAAALLVMRFGLRLPPSPGALAIEQNNRGVGLLGQYDYDGAREQFQTLVDTYPDWLDARVNLAIALLNRQQEGDNDVALSELSRVLEADPDHLRANYCSGLLRLYLESPQAALENFRKVADADPSDAYAAYYVGQCLAQTQAYDEAVAWYERSLQRDPYLRSAYYALAQAYQRLGRSEDAAKMMETFTRLADNPRASLVQFVYTRMGQKGMAMAVDLSEPSSARPPSGAVFEPLRALPLENAAAGAPQWAPSSGRPAGVTVCDVNGDGALDLFLTRAVQRGGADGSVLLLNNGSGSFEQVADHPLSAVADVNAVLWGDIDNDGLTDAYLCRSGSNQLWSQRASGTWEEITSAAGVAGGEEETVDGAIFDADHDGDLDIFCVNANGPNELWSNNLDGTFRPLAGAQGISGGDRRSLQVLVADLDGDRDVDLIVLNDDAPNEVYLNDRLWTYRPAPAFDALIQAPLRAAVAGDLNGDGRPEIYGLGDEGEVSRFDVDDDGQWAATFSWTALGEAPACAHPKLLLADVNGDGRAELLVSDGCQWRAFDAPQGATPQAIFTAEESGRGLGAALFDPARGPALVAVRNGKAPVIWDPGPGRFPFLGLSFAGQKDAGNSMRSNASGIGTYAAARAGSTWIMANTLREDSGPGQSLQPLAIGLGGEPRVDFVAIDWSDGVFQSEIELDAGRLHEITETQRQLSSCPVLFAFDGERFRFVSDILGVGGIGFAVGPGEYGEPRPWERFLFPPGVPRARAGRFPIKIGEPMEEAMYLDAARLVAYDLPPGWSMVLDERFAILGPSPTGEPRFVERSVVPVRAVNERGEVVTDAVERADLVAAPPGPLDHRFIGRLTGEHVLTLSFDQNLSELGGELLLVAEGWIEYPYSQTMFSAWQAGADYRAPSIEAKGADGRWRLVREQFGYPAGMPRTMSVPLGDLPPGTTELRLTTNQEIYWDFLAVAVVESCPSAKRTELPLRSAELQRTGFPHRPPLPQHRPDYDYDRRRPLWDTRHQSGFYTRFGDVTPLMEEADQALVIAGPGEEVHLEFGAALDPLPAGWSRRFVLEAEGWCKDMDLYTRDGETIEPLPGESTAARERLHRQFNTRFQAGY